MNEKEIGEIRRRVRRDRSNMTAIYGCYVNGQKEIVSEFKKSTGIMPENEAERYFGLLKRTLSGSIGKNLIDICFKTSQVAGSPEHKLLMDLRNCKLNDESLRAELYQKIIQSVSFDDGFLILIGCDSYDVPFKSKDDETQADASSESYTYLLCAVCPVKQTKPSLRYVAEEKDFQDGGIAQVPSAPEVGFLFPAFDNRATNIYNALYYTHSAKESQEALVDALFRVNVPKPAEEQKRSFEALLGATLQEECSMDVVQTVHDELCQCIAMHKESKVADPLLISKEQVKGVLEGCGVSQQHIAKFSVEYDEVFGFEAQLHPKNIINNKRFVITTPDVSIQVSPERSDLIETRIIDGVKYILICADESVEVNGVPITITDKDAIKV
ncbi:MAG: DUF4317 domain-containing protein [Oscillospiraceae bacterium]|nr:DUF4317 domain-containing protein [Oscillospiraceae bacterium]